MSKAFPTFAAGKRLLTGMYFPVFDQAGLVYEASATDHAGVLALISVLLLMEVEQLPLRESLATFRA